MSIGVRRVVTVAAATLTVLAAAGVGAAASTVRHQASAPSWKRQSIAPSGQLAGVACASSGHCAAVRYDGYASVMSHGKWGSPRRIAGAKAGLQAVECSTSVCTASIGQTHAALLHGSTWTTLPAFAPTGRTGAASCWDATHCLAVESQSSSNKSWYRTLVGGKKWSTPTYFYTGFVDNLDCLSASFCAATDSNGGAALTFDGKSWHSTKGLRTGSFPVQLSCPSRTFCAFSNSLPYEGTSNGTVFLYNGHTWHGPVYKATSAGDLGPISCASAKLCLMTDYADSKHLPGGGHLITYANGHWSKPVTFDKGEVLISVGCSTSRFCAVVDHLGHALTRQFPK